MRLVFIRNFTKQLADRSAYLIPRGEAWHSAHPRRLLKNPRRFFAPFSLCGIKQLHVILPNDLSRGGVTGRIPMVTVFIHGILQRQDSIKEFIADGTKFKTGKEKPEWISMWMIFSYVRI